jgi:hypothetical protein
LNYLTGGWDSNTPNSYSGLFLGNALASQPVLVVLPNGQVIAEVHMSGYSGESGSLSPGVGSTGTGTGTGSCVGSTCGTGTGTGTTESCVGSVGSSCSSSVSNTNGYPPAYGKRVSWRQLVQ